MLDVPIVPAAVLFECISHSRARVTVAVSLYNYGPVVLEALETVAAQDLEDLDVVIVDDCSNDGGDQRVSDWLGVNKNRFGRSVLLRHHANQGLAAARNSAFASAATPYVFVLDADNQIYPRCLTACLSTALANNADAVYTILEVFGESEGVMGTDLWDPIALQSGNYIDAMALISRAAWQRLGGYRRMSVDGWEDYDFWLKFAESGLEPLRVPQILCRYRKRQTSMLRTVTDQPENTRLLHADMHLHHPAIQLRLEPS